MRRIRNRTVTLGVAMGGLTCALMAMLFAGIFATTGAPLSSSPNGILTAAQAQAQTPSASWLGLYPGNTGPAGVTDYDQWLGAPVNNVTLFIDSSDWKYIDQPEDYGLQDYENQPYQLVLSVPIIPTDATGDTLAQGATGAYNAHFSSFAKNLVAMGMGHVILRLGWELTGNWFPWSAINDPSDYAAYWRQIVDTMRSVPGADFKFDWNGGNGGPTSFDPTAAYPGDAYVDYISADVYDDSWQYYKNNVSSPAATQSFFVNDVENGAYALDWTASFAAAHGKPMAIPEWGLQLRPDGMGGGDDPTFIQDMYTFITTHDVAYADYFDYDSYGTDSNLTDGNFPQSASVYQQLFASAAPTSPATTPATTSTTRPPAPPTTSPSTTLSPLISPASTSPTTIPGGTPSSPVIANTYVGTTETTPSVQYNALAAQSNLSTETRWPGYTGSAYLYGWGDNGDYVTFTVNAPTAGNYIAGLRYSAGSGQAIGEIKVNGAVVSTEEVFPKTTNWSTWAVQDIPVSLVEGVNTVTVLYAGSTGSAGILNVNYLDLASEASSTGAIAGVVTSTTGSVPPAQYNALAAQTNLSTETRWPGYSGTAYLYGWGDNGDYVTFTVNAPTAGNYIAGLRYSAGFRQAAGEIAVDGAVTDAQQVFPKTANWSTWATQDFEVSLQQGANTITVLYNSAVGSGGILNINFLQLS